MYKFLNLKTNKGNRLQTINTVYKYIHMYISICPTDETVITIYVV